MVCRTMIIAKVVGVTGIKVNKAQSLLVVAGPTVGAIFFHGCGTSTGNNLVGRSFNTSGNIINFPRYWSKALYNSYAAPLIYIIAGLSTVLNYTRQALRGPGLDKHEALKLLSDHDKVSIPRDIKCLIIQKLGGNC